MLAWQFLHHSDMPDPYATRVCVASSDLLGQFGATAIGGSYTKA
jgi:hypothetical protein